MAEDALSTVDQMPAAQQTKRRWRPWSADMPRTAISELLLRAIHADSEVMLYAARVSVWLRWFVWAVALAQLAHRPEFWIDTHREYLFLHVPLVVFNGFVHYRLHRGGTVTWRWLLFLHAVDIALITGAIVMAADFDIHFFVAYYVALALFAVVFTSLWLVMTWTTVVALVYSVVSLTVHSGLDFTSGEEKALLGRVAAMYGIVGCVSLIARFERVRRQRSAEREQELHRQRIELSQAIHDTAAQTAYMVSMGVHRAMRQAGSANEELAQTLAATASLSKAAVWELRRPIDEGRLFEGRDLGGVLWSHTETFGQIAAVAAEMRQTGTEPDLPVATRAGLFSIAHNALTNAFLHAEASRVEVRLDFDDGAVRLSVWDDGVGLPDDYATRGRGFQGMTADAERLGGRLIVETGGTSGTTTITCEMPLQRGS